MFVVDASIFPGMPSTNPSALIVVAAEHASDLILALPANTAVARYGQCGGLYYTGSQACASPYTCTYGNAYYWQVRLALPYLSDNLYLHSPVSVNPLSKHLSEERSAVLHSL
jgi:hypothetical protein